jgi:hypothetical protein
MQLGPPLPPPAGPPPGRVTDDDVTQALDRARDCLINQRLPDGTFRGGEDYTTLALMTLAYMGEHPNHEVMARGLEYLMNSSQRPAAAGGRPGYAVPIRIMALCYLCGKLAPDKQAAVRLKVRSDIELLIRGQNPLGGWRYQLDRSDYDFSVTQWPILAMYEAGRMGIEFPPSPLVKARGLYFQNQRPDGGWAYQGNSMASYGSMTAAGLASLFIINDLVEPASGCPCANGRSQPSNSEIERHMDAALGWLSENFTADRNPGRAILGSTNYWLYCVERVGIGAGYKYFGRHNWYREGAEHLVGAQAPGGHWGELGDTCFAMLFLYKGRAPVLFNKLRFDGIWNPHRRDLASLTAYIERVKEQRFHWQIVDLAAPLEELHDAPILYISAESIPRWGPQDLAKLRAFTDTGGTILLEASCGNPAVRSWVTNFAKQVWPEWRLAPLGPEHGVFTDPYPLPKRPELMGISDGLRTFLIYSMDDISCPWHMRAFAAKEYLFQWGINLFTYATDHAALRAKLAGAEPSRTSIFQPVRAAGPRKKVRIARLRHSGNWEVGANYGAWATLAERLKSDSDVTIEVKEPRASPVTDGGTPAQALAGFDAAYITGTQSFAMTDPERDALGKWTAAGGFLLAEAAAGSAEFDESFKTLAAQMGWDLKDLPATHPLITGQMAGAQGYDLATGVEFRRALRLVRAGKPQAELLGVFAGDRMIGVYSPFDILFSMTGHEAYGCRGYKAQDAAAVATNLVLYLTTPPSRDEKKRVQDP